MPGLVLFCAAYYLAAAVGAEIGYHRCLTHRAFTVPRWLGCVLVTLGLPAGTPVGWADNHRCHHANTDTVADPHSPHYGGFWHAHCGWYFGSANPALCLLYALAGPFRLLVDAWIRPRALGHARLAGDVAADPYYAFLSRPIPYAAAMAVHMAVSFGFTYWTWGPVGFFALWATLVFAYNCGDAINSFGHLFGLRAEGSGSHAGNFRPLVFLAFGAGWHADHHRFPGSARAGSDPGQFDPGWLTIRLLSAFGLARDIVVLPRPDLGRTARERKEPIL